MNVNRVSSLVPLTFLVLSFSGMARAEFGDDEARAVVKRGRAGGRSLPTLYHPPYRVGDGGYYDRSPIFLKKIDDTTSLVDDEYETGGVNVNGGASTPVRSHSQPMILKGVPNKNESTGSPFQFTQGKAVTVAITGVQEYEGQQLMVMEPFDFKPYLKPAKRATKGKKPVSDASDPTPTDLVEVQAPKPVTGFGDAEAKAIVAKTRAENAQKIANFRRNLSSSPSIFYADNFEAQQNLAGLLRVPPIPDLNPPLKVGDGGFLYSSMRFVSKIDDSTCLVEIETSHEAPQTAILRGFSFKDRATNERFSLMVGDRPATVAVPGLMEIDGGQRYVIVESFDFTPYLALDKPKPKAKSSNK